MKSWLPYADGELKPEQSDAIERVLASDPETAERVEALKATHGHIQGCLQ